MGEIERYSKQKSICHEEEKFASKHQKSTWPQTSSWTLVCPSSLSPSWLMFPSKVVASALERFEFDLHGRDYLDCWTFINCFASQNIVSTAFIWLAQQLTAYFRQTLYLYFLSICTNRFSCF